MTYFILTNGRNYLTINLKDNSVKTVPTENLAFHFESEKKAKNVLSNLPKCFKNLNYYCSVVTEEEPKSDKSGKIIDCKHYTTNTDIELDEDFVNINDILSITQPFDSLVSYLSGKREHLENKLKILNGRMNDIEHCIEFKSVNACEGYKLYKQLRDVRIERRKVKNSLLILDIIDSSMSDMYRNTNNITFRIEGIQNRIYQIRQQEELFK